MYKDQIREWYQDYTASEILVLHTKYPPMSKCSVEWMDKVVTTLGHLTRADANLAG